MVKGWSQKCHKFNQDPASGFGMTSQQGLLATYFILECREGSGWDLRVRANAALAVASGNLEIRES